MNRKLSFLLTLLLLVPILSACGAAATAQQELPTPTPLPPATVLERPTYPVERGPIERVLSINGRVTPVDLAALGFRAEGRIVKVHVKRGDVVQEGAVLAELQQEDALDSLRQAQDSLAQARRALEQKKKDQARAIREAEVALQDAQEDLTALLPGGANDPIAQAQKELAETQRKAIEADRTGSETKTQAEYDLLLKSEAVQNAQKAYSDAFWDNDWAQKYGTDPNNFTEDPQTGRKIYAKLTEEGVQKFADDLLKAERELRNAEREVELQVRKLDQSREKEIYDNTQQEQEVKDKQAALDRLLQGEGNKDLIQARRGVQAKELALEEARQLDLTDETKAIEDAQRSVDKAQRKVTDGQIIAPQNGEVISIAIREGDNAEAFTPVIEIADPSNLEAATELSGEQMRQLAEGQPAIVSLLSRPDVLMPALIRRMPGGAGGSGAVQDQDKTTRFQITDLKGQTLTLGAVVKITIVLERKDNVLLLPPDAVRAFEGRNFVVVREGDRDRRVTVRVGIKTDEKWEILEGVKQGDIVVGQ